MQNQPLHQVFHDSDSDQELLADPPSAIRFRLMIVLFVAALSVILGRIAWVQGALPERYLAALNVVSVDYETIPARHGRILSESAEVLAADIDRYSVEVHYRWLQSPADETWLGNQVRKRLSRSERFDSRLRAAAETEILSERQQMWTAVADVVDVSADDLRNRRQKVQDRVERIADAVNRRRTEQNSPPDLSTDGSGGIMMRIATAVRTALTTPPRRSLSERIVVREEESFHTIIPDVSLDVAAQIRQQPNRFPGVRIAVGHRRTYPQGRVAAHIVGARTPPRDEEVVRAAETGESPDPATLLARFGVERSYDHQLRSVPGLRRIVRNRRMEVLETEVERKPVSGRDVVLTLNFRLQKHAENLLAEALMDVPRTHLPAPDAADGGPQPVPSGGSVVVMDVENGRLLVAASAPGFDLSLFTGGRASDWEAVNSDQRNPFICRSIAMVQPPGSAMKPFTAAAALETGVIDPDAFFFCQGFLRVPEEHRCLIYRLYGNGHHEINLSRALAQSCNVYFFSAAQQMGFTRLRHWCEQFGFGRATGIDLPFEQPGHLPGTTARGDAVDTRMKREVPGLAIGQSSLTVTPVQMTRAMAAIANGGWLVMPHVVSPEGTARTTSDIDDHPLNLSRHRIAGLSAASLEWIREGLRAVVQEPYGTGYQTVRLDEVAIAGKTGTAETAPGKPDHAWFVGYVPADKPQFAFAVVLEHGGSGSRAAGPVVRELVREMIKAELLSSHQ